MISKSASKASTLPLALGSKKEDRTKIVLRNYHIVREIQRINITLPHPWKVTAKDNL